MMMPSAIHSTIQQTTVNRENWQTLSYQNQLARFQRLNQSLLGSVWQRRIVAPGIKIRGLRVKELHEVLEWVGDPTFRRDFLPFSKASERETTRELRKMVGSGRPHFLGIEKTSSRRLIGLLSYHRPQGFDYFEVGFYLVPLERGKGYGPDALNRLVSLLFEKNCVATILAGTSSLNEASQRALEKAGFKREGLWKKTLFRDGKWEDSIIYVLYRDERAQGRLSS